MTELFWRPFRNVRTQERSRILFFAGLATLISLAQMLGLIGAEALFLAEFGVRFLPVAFIGGSLATVAGSIAYAMRVGEARNDSLFIQMLLGTGAVLVAATALLLNRTPWVSTFLFCFYLVTQAIFVNHLWTFTSDYFDTVASKRLIPLLTMGASLGGAIGGELAAGSSRAFGSESLIGGWGLLLFCAALLLRIGRRNLRGWGPIEIEEADETSVEGIQGAIRYMRASKLGLALFAAAIGMTLALIIARYMWLDAFAREFPDSDDLAAFIGHFMFVTNLAEIAIAMTIVPWLIRQFGVPSVNLFHPISTLFSFAGLAVNLNIFTGTIARMNGEMIENALAVPIRAMLCNAIPLRFRNRVRAFLEGIVANAAMSIGGAMLLLLGIPEPRLLAIAGIGASFTYLIANLLVRREYMRTLVDQLRSGRLDLSDIGDEIGDWEAHRLAGLWEELLNTEGERPSALLLKMVPSLASRRILEPLTRAAAHPNPVMRRSCVIALAGTDDPAADRAIAIALGDTVAEVRLAAARSLANRRGDSVPQDFNQRLMNDPDPRVRAEAAERAGPEGLAILDIMLASDDSLECVAALSAAPESLLASVLERLQDPSPEIRAAALEFVARCRSSEPTLEDARAAFDHSDSRVRRAAVLLLANIEPNEAHAMLASALDDPSSEVQLAAESVLGALADFGIGAVEEHLGTDNERTVQSALRVVAHVDSERSREVLLRELRDRAHELWYWVIALQRIQNRDSLSARFLRLAFGDGIARNRRICFQILEHLENPAIVRNVDKVLRFGSLRARGDALEVLSHLGDREVAQHLVILHETGPIDDRMEDLERIVSVPVDLQELVDAAITSRARWVRLAAIVWRGDQDEPPPEEKTMERLLALKRVSLFNRLSLDQLEAVHHATSEEEFLDGEVIMRQDERGDRLYLLLEGRVRVYLRYAEANQVELAPMEAVTYVGEMAVLDGGVRSATIVSAGRTRLLSLDGNSLRELVMQMPEISFEIFGVLASRVRVAENLLSETQ